MQKAKTLAHKSFYFLGERLAFLLVIFVFTGLLFIETTHQAFSEEEEVYLGYTKEGLTFDNYLSFPYSYAVESVSTLSHDYSEIDSASHIVIKDPEPAKDAGSEDIWDAIASCESGGNWGINTGNGYYGGLQFSQGAWNSVGGTGLPSDASKEEQIEKGKALQQKRGWGVWGLCAKKLGL